MSEQITITVITEQNREGIRLVHDTGKTVLYTLRADGIILPSLCDGMGKCGRCRVKFPGYAPFPTQTDRAVISPDKLREGYRLACMARPLKDCVVETAFMETQKIDVLTVSRIADEEKNTKYGEKENSVEKAEGKGGSETIVAVDIGTTTIAMQLLKVVSGEILDTYTCLNPQRSYGTDVIARIRAGSEGQAGVLKKLVREALSSGMDQFGQYVEEYGLCRPELMVIAGNTTMGHLFMGYPVDSLGRSPFTPVNIKTVEMEYLGMRAVLVPGISAFVGGDITAGLYACGLCQESEGNGMEQDKAWLFLDLGTNAEMVIGIGERMICTAAAAGPAFEGKGENGALGADRICAIAQLLEKGMVDKTGLLMEPYFESGITVNIETETNRGQEPKRKEVYITQEDIRDIQMAKAAVRTGIHFLVNEIGAGSYEQIGKVYVAGGFGFYLNPEAAERIGLLPERMGVKMVTAGNTSLAGAGMLGKMAAAEYAKGKNPGMRVMERLEKYTQQAESFNLAEIPSFEKEYIGYLNFPV